MFVDLTHPVFRAYRVRPEPFIADELAQYIHVVNGRLQAQYAAQHSVANLTWLILEKRWGDVLEDSPNGSRMMRGHYSIAYAKHWQPAQALIRLAISRS